MAMKVIRCRICGETYLGEDTPDKCPFCGAAKEYMIAGIIWKDENNIELTETSRKNIESAIELEVGNSRFYLCAASAAKDENNELEGMFKRLAKIEREHASLLSKIIKSKVPDIINKPLECSKDEFTNIRESKRREENAVQQYTRFLNEANEPRVRTVFKALIAIENTHIELDENQRIRIEK